MFAECVGELWGNIRMHRGIGRLEKWKLPCYLGLWGLLAATTPYSSIVIVL